MKLLRFFRKQDDNMPRTMGRVIPIAPEPMAKRDPSRDPLSIVVKNLVSSELAKFEQQLKEMERRAVRSEHYAAHVERLSNEVIALKGAITRLKKKGVVEETIQLPISSEAYLTPPTFVGETLKCKIKGVVSFVIGEDTDSPVLCIHDGDSPKRVTGKNLREQVAACDLYLGDQIEVSVFKDDTIQIAVLKRGRRKKKPA